MSNGTSSNHWGLKGYYGMRGVVCLMNVLSMNISCFQRERSFTVPCKGESEGVKTMKIAPKVSHSVYGGGHRYKGGIIDPLGSLQRMARPGAFIQDNRHCDVRGLVDFTYISQVLTLSVGTASLNSKKKKHIDLNSHGE